MKRFNLQNLLAVAICLALPTLSLADLSNTANVTYQDAASNSYGPTASNTVIVSVTVKPVITSALVATGDVGVLFNYQIAATNSPTSYNATGLPNGLLINTITGVISGTPVAGGTSNVTLTATNAAGSGTAILVLTVHAAAVIALQKSSDKASAVPGDVVTFTLSYQNTTNGAATSVVLSDVIPAGSTLVGGSITGGGTLSAGTITWNLGTIPGNGTGSVSFKVTVN